jgi:hypothetical protein
VACVLTWRRAAVGQLLLVCAARVRQSADRGRAPRD